MKVAAYQAPLLPAGSTTRALRLIRRQIDRCETAGVEMLCCPEGVLGGLADYATHPAAFALDAERQLREVLEPLTSDRVTTIVGFTEVDRRGRLHNAAVVWHKGSVAGSIASFIRRSTDRSMNRAMTRPSSPSAA